MKCEIFFLFCLFHHFLMTRTFGEQNYTDERNIEYNSEDQTGKKRDSKNINNGTNRKELDLRYRRGGKPESKRMRQNDLESIFGLMNEKEKYAYKNTLLIIHPDEKKQLSNDRPDEDHTIVVLGTNDENGQHSELFQFNQKGEIVENIENLESWNDKKKLALGPSYPDPEYLSKEDQKLSNNEPDEDDTVIVVGDENGQHAEAYKLNKNFELVEKNENLVSLNDKKKLGLGSFLLFKGFERIWDIIIGIFRQKKLKGNAGKGNKGYNNMRYDDKSEDLEDGAKLEGNTNLPHNGPDEDKILVMEINENGPYIRIFNFNKTEEIVKNNENLQRKKLFFLGIVGQIAARAVVRVVGKRVVKKIVQKVIPKDVFKIMNTIEKSIQAKLPKPVTDAINILDTTLNVVDNTIDLMEEFITLKKVNVGNNGPTIPDKKNDTGTDDEEKFHNYNKEAPVLSKLKGNKNLELTQDQYEREKAAGSMADLFGSNPHYSYPTLYEKFGRRLFRRSYDTGLGRESIRAKIMPGTKLYELISVLKRKSPRLLYVINVEENIN